MVSSNTFSLSLILFLSFFFSPSQSHNKVSLELYYESLCPYSADFIVNDLPIIFQHDLLSIVDLKLVPWGNAKLGPNSTITCQVISLINRLVINLDFIIFIMVLT
jgi:interferon gamma-inducible protein 30